MLWSNILSLSSPSRSIFLHWECMLQHWNFIPSLKLHSFMYLLLVLSELTLWTSLVITFPAWELHSLMYLSLLLSKMILCRFTVFTFPAWINPSCIGWRCQVRSPFEVALTSHSLHGYLFTSYNVCWFWVRLHFEGAWRSHYFHGSLPFCVLHAGVNLN